MSTTSNQIENVILRHSQRGMAAISRGLEPGYCCRAAELLRNHPGVVLIGTGFPVNGSFETDGPIGALALSRVLEHLGSQPVFVCGPPLADILKPFGRTLEIPILDPEGTTPWVEQVLLRYQPAVIVSVERPGMADDGRYYNMRGQDITAVTMKFDLFFEKAACPTIAFGDGGNEVGMGNLGCLRAALAVTPSKTRCDELVVATVSNWGVYGVIAELSRMSGEDLFRLFNPEQIADHLVSNGSLDGVTYKPIPSEDGFTMNVGRGVIQALRRAVNFDPEVRRAAGGR